MGKSEKLLEKICKEVSGLELSLDHDFTKLSTMRLKSRGRLITVRNKEALKELLPFLMENNLEYKVLGWGANILLPEELPWVAIQLKFEFNKNYLDDVHEKYDLPANVSLSILSSHATKFGLKGWEVFTGIPATLGGAIFMNAGTNLGEICNVVEEVEIVDGDGKFRIHVPDENSFSYRKSNFLKKGDVITMARLTHFGQDPSISELIKTYLEMRNSSQPLKEFTCGCIFKNTTCGSTSCRAGHYMDIMGMKGFTLGNVSVSHKHGNFLENSGKSNYSETLRLMKILKKELGLQFGVDFEFEVEH